MAKPITEKTLREEHNICEIYTSDKEFSKRIMTLDRAFDLYNHHQSIRNGYIPRKYSAIIVDYYGRYGNGYAVIRYYNNTRVTVDYLIER